MSAPVVVNAPEFGIGRDRDQGDAAGLEDAQHLPDCGLIVFEVFEHLAGDDGMNARVLQSGFRHFCHPETAFGHMRLSLFDAGRRFVKAQNLEAPVRDQSGQTALAAPGIQDPRVLYYGHAANQKVQQQLVAEPLSRAEASGFAPFSLLDHVSSSLTGKGGSVKGGMRSAIEKKLGGLYNGRRSNNAQGEQDEKRFMGGRADFRDRCGLGGAGGGYLRGAGLDDRGFVSGFCGCAFSGVRLSGDSVCAAAGGRAPAQAAGPAGQA